MNIAQIENNLQQLVTSLNKETFVYDLLLAYGQPKASITRLQQGGLNLSKTAGEIVWKKKLFFKAVQDEDLHELIDDIKADDRAIKHDPRFIVVTDYETLLAIDRKTSDTLDIPVLDIARHYDFFLPWAGMEKYQGGREQEADVKAAERMAKLYDEIKKDNPTTTHEEVHNLNVFLSRLLFCFFAEDTGIFEKGQFTNAISSHTQADGSDLHTYFDKLFDVMNTEPGKRKNLPAFLEAFPYVNGGLFKDKRHAPVFTRRSRQAIIDSGELDWSAINPDIFGSMIQAVITPEHRGGLGMHYTSVPNIMKVIEPLFLNELYEEFEAAKGNNKKLEALLHRIYSIKIFDPACGSGNFLIISYKELRRLEMKIFKAMTSLALSNISLSHFYGIELDDFAHEVAILSLWLAEHQMNQEFFKEFGRTKPALPLKETGNIFHGNATRLDWEKVCPKKEGDEIYVLGNPPYLGYALQSPEQKEDMAIVFRGIEDYKKLDFISCWFYLGSRYIKKFNAKYAFVTTNSICQGEQVAILWPNIFKSNLEIDFAYQSFKWKNNAKAVAGVTVVIIGIRNSCNKEKKLFIGNTCSTTREINAYLVASTNIIVSSRNKPLSNLPEMIIGSKATDDGNLILTEKDKNDILKNYPEGESLIKKYVGADEFINGSIRYCLLVTNKDLKLAYSIPPIVERFKKCHEFRKNSKKRASQLIADIPYAFDEQKYKPTNAIIIPQTTSEKREYIPIGFLDGSYVISNGARLIYDAESWMFSVLTSKIHNVWIQQVAGRLETRIQYSNTLCYNTFPFPSISEIQKKELEKHVYHILEEREHHSEKTLAQLYDSDKMPQGLREAHHQLDLAVERCYRSRPFENDEERLEYLFKLYEQMIAEEKESNGELNFDHPKSKRRRK
ncbi:MAG: class I SAM-dependent DNA methyltransferase [Nitrospirae bacterium]|nr:MAG: class I SAM-dependent DNA methyltransferase [Nitrospirota bacterium]